MLRFSRLAQTALRAFSARLRHPIQTLLIASPLLLAACDKAATEAPHMRTVLVQTFSQPTGQRAVLAEYSGTVRARVEQMLAFQVSGKIIERTVELGDNVAAGKILARIDAKDLKLQHDSVLAQSRAAKTQVELAQAELERARTLHAKGFLSVAVLDARKNALDVTRAAYKQAQAQLALSQNQMRYAQLRAPQNGVISAVLAERGQVVAAGTPVLQLIEPEQREIEFYIPQNRLHQYRKGQQATVHLNNDPALSFKAELREIAPAADPMIRAYRARLRLSDTQKQNLIEQAPFGATAQVTFYSETEHKTELPLAAVTAINGTPSIWIVDAQNTLQTQPVRISASHANTIEILSTLPEKTRVVISGLPLLVAGEQVRAIDADADLTMDAAR